MKKLFVFLCLLTAPLSLSAHIITASKAQMLSSAKFHKDSALYYLHQADLCASFLPELDKREHLHMLITSTISSAAISDPRMKLLTIGLSILGSFATEMYDKYFDTRKYLVKAAYHLEQMNHYNRLSLEINNSEGTDEGTRQFVLAFDYLTITDMLTTCIRHSAQGLNISNHICGIRDSLIKQLYENPPGKLVEKPSRQVYYFIENFDEITSEVVMNNEKLIKEIFDYLVLALYQFQLTEKAWGLVEEDDKEWILFKEEMIYLIKQRIQLGL